MTFIKLKLLKLSRKLNKIQGPNLHLFKTEEQLHQKKTGLSPPFADQIKNSKQLEIENEKLKWKADITGYKKN